MSGVARAGSKPARCPWAAREPLVSYHDREWGVPRRRERALFELLVLEGAQAGLSWETILRKRAGYRAAFQGFNPELVARFTSRDVTRLLAHEGIVRHRGKIESAITNARALLLVRQEWAGRGGFAGYIWSFVSGRAVVNARTRPADVPTTSVESEAMSKDLRRRGFRFVGPTTCYAFMQAAGLVNDHLRSCFRWEQVQLAGADRSHAAPR